MSSITLTSAQTAQVATRDELVRKYQTAPQDHPSKSVQQIAGVRASLARKIGDLDEKIYVSLSDDQESTLYGDTPVFVPWIKPTTVKVTDPTESAEDAARNIALYDQKIDTCRFESMIPRLQSSRADHVKVLVLRGVVESADDAAGIAEFVDEITASVESGQ